MKNGFENNFIWNSGEPDPCRNQRLIQVRGKIINCEDFSQIVNTYPKHPLSEVKPNLRTQTELKIKRKNDLMDNLRKGRERWEKMNPTSAVQEFCSSDFYITHPR